MNTRNIVSAFKVKMLAPCAGVILLVACATSSPVATSAPAPTSTQAPTTESAATETATTAPATTEVATTSVEATATTQSAQPVATTKKLNLNTASADEFLTAPNVGQRMVREFNEYRPYTTILQFRREIGKYVDAATVAEYEKYLYVPVSPNNADADTLQQLPGVDQTIAAQLIAARPYDSRDAFLKKLAELATPEQAAAGAAYVEAE